CRWAGSRSAAACRRGPPRPGSPPPTAARREESMTTAARGVLDGKVALITGAATGIGRASALLFARSGARVALTDVRGPALARRLRDVRRTGGEAASTAADLARPEDCAKAVAAAVEAFGRLDVLLNNAGVGTMVVGGTVETIGLEHWDLAQDVNVRAMYLLSRAAIAHMRKVGGGAVVNIASVSSFRGSVARPP